MSFDDAAPPKSAEQFWPSARRLIGLFGPVKGWFALAAVFTVLGVVLSVIAPAVLGRAMDVIFNGVLGSTLPSGDSARDVAAQLRADGNSDLADLVLKQGITPGQGIDFVRLSQLIILVLLLYFVASLAEWLSGYILNRITMRVIYGLRADIEAKLHRLPIRYFDRRQRGDVLSRVTNDVDNMQQALQQAFAQIVRAGTTVIGIGIIMFVLSWQLALIALLALPLSAAIAGFVGVRSQKLFVAQWEHTGKVNGHIEESFTGHELVRVFNRDAEMAEEFAEKNEALYRAAAKAQFLSGTMMPLMQFVTYFTYVLIAVVGALRVTSGQMTLGQVTAFIQYSREFSQPIGQIAGVAHMLQSGVASAERTFALLDADEETVDHEDAQLPEPVRGRVVFEHVNFAYEPEQPLIEDLSLVAEPGKTVAIVGPTGAGKTTLVNLLMRFYELDSGRITIDGVDIAKLSRGALRRHMGMVLQDAYLFDGTIRENIRYGRPTASDAEVVRAAEATLVDHFVRLLPDGYDTVLNENASALSSGERQLLTIARAFLSDPAILILDEATSSVDTRTEVLVQEAMQRLRHGRTAFVIAHRLSTIRDADLIVMMDQGRVVEQGTHSALVARDGAYAELYRAQFAQAAVTLDGETDAEGGEPA